MPICTSPFLCISERLPCTGLYAPHSIPSAWLSSFLDCAYSVHGLLPVLSFQSVHNFVICLFIIHDMRGIFYYLALIVHHRIYA